jgi:hypothetical protein
VLDRSSGAEPDGPPHCPDPVLELRIFERGPVILSVAQIFVPYSDLREHSGRYRHVGAENVVGRM